MFDLPYLLFMAVFGLATGLTCRPSRRPQAEPRYWSICPPDSEKEIRVEQGMTPEQVAGLARQIVRNAEASGAAGDVAFTPPEFRKPTGSVS